MVSIRPAILLRGLLFGLCLAVGGALSAQELGYSGLGANNHAMAGATAALPIDSSGSLFWNPATLGALKHGDFQVAFGRIDAPWYGDESLANIALFPVVLVGALAVAALDGDDDYEWWREDKRSPEFDFAAEAYASFNSALRTAKRVRGTSLSFALPADRQRRWGFGMGFSQTGALKTRILAHPETARPIAAMTYRTKRMELSPTLSYRIRNRLHFGISPLLSMTEFPAAAMPTLPGYERTMKENHVGFGLQLGVYYMTKRNFNIGFSVQSPHWTSSQNVRWIAPDDTVRESRLRYSTEHPMRYVLGISYTGFERVHFAVDVRHYDFQHLSSFYEVTGGKPVKRATSLAAGVQIFKDPEESMFVFRFGYQFTDAGMTGWEDWLYNRTPPLSRGHSIHYGIGLGTPSKRGWEVSFSLSHSFGSGRIHYPTPGGTSSFRRNPNTNAFWWSVRYKY